MVLFIKPPATIAQVTLVLRPSEKGFCSLSAYTVYVNRNNKQSICNIKTELKLSFVPKIVFYVSRELKDRSNRTTCAGSSMLLLLVPPTSFGLLYRKGTSSCRIFLLKATCRWVLVDEHTRTAFTHMVFIWK